MDVLSYKNLLDAAQEGNLIPIKLAASADPKLLSCIIPGCPFGECILHYAAYNGHEKLVTFILQQGVNPNVVGTISGSTPLHSAASGGHIGVGAILLQSGSHINALTISGWTPLDCATAKNYDLCIWFLKKHGGIFAKTKEPLPAIPQPDLNKQPQLSKLLPNGNLHVQIASDLHLEFYGDNPIPDDIIIPSAPILALCGDIGIPYMNNFEAWILKQCDRFELVLFLCGNHEFYNSNQIYTVDTIKEMIKSISIKSPKFLFMDKGTLVIENFCILGTTLWCDIPQEDRAGLQQNLNDFNLIYTSPHQRLVPEVFVSWYNDQAAWLHMSIQTAKQRNQKCLILTHHSPTFNITGSGVGWSSNLDQLFKEAHPGSPVEVWVFGHTHANVDKVISGTRVVSNQRGYIPNTKKNYNPRMFVSIEK